MTSRLFLYSLALATLYFPVFAEAHYAPRTIPPENSECYHMGYRPNTQAFEQCRERIRNAIDQAKWEDEGLNQPDEDSFELNNIVNYFDNEEDTIRMRDHARHSHYYERPPFNPNDYYDEYGRRCKKTHRGWILCK